MGGNEGFVYLEQGSKKSRLSNFAIRIVYVLAHTHMNTYRYIHTMYVPVRKDACVVDMPKCLYAMKQTFLYKVSITLYTLRLNETNAKESLIRELDAGEAMPATQIKGARAETLKCSAGVKGKADAGATSALSAEEWQWREEGANGMRPQKNAIEAKAHSDDASKDCSKKHPSSKLERWALRTGQGMSGGEGGGELSVHNLSSHMADAAARGVDKDAAQSIAIESLSLQDASSCVGGGGGGQSRTRTVEINRNQGAPNEIVRLAFGRLPEKWDGPCEITGFVPWENARVSGKLRPGELMIFSFNLSSRLRYHTLNVR